MRHRKITFYLGTTVIGSILLVLLLLVGLELIFSFVNELRFVGTGQYATAQAFLTIILLLPSQIAQLFPMAALVGCLLGLSTLATRSELVILRAAGLSITDITLALFKMGFILVLLAWLLGEVVAPITDKWAHAAKSVSLSSGQALGTQHGIWMRDGPLFVHIQSIEKENRLLGVTRYQMNDNLELTASSTAQSAIYEDDHWVLSHVAHTHFYPDHTESSVEPSEIWYSHIAPEILGIVGDRTLEELNIIELWRSIGYRAKNHLDPRPYQLAFWQKVARPLSTFVMIFLAIPFVFGPLRQSTMGLRLLVGILVGFAFYTLSQLFGPLVIVYPIPPIVGAFLPAILFLMIGLGLLKKSH
jgi:lipopolysaccharide export system permease protein